MVLLFLLTLLVNQNSNAQSYQSVLDSLVTITFNNQRLNDALEQMEIQTHITFSYKSGLIKENKIINKHFEKEPVEKILQQLIDNDSIFFSAIGQQIAFYVPRNTKFVTIEKVVLKAVEVPVLQNVYIRDTVIISRVDTIQNYTTVKVTDTLRIINKVGRYSLSTFLSLSPVNPKLKLTDNTFKPIYDDLMNAESSGIMSRFGFLGTLHYKNYALSTGAGLSFLRNKADYNFTSYITDSTKVIDHKVTATIVSFITDSFSIISSGDTVYGYVYDNKIAIDSVENIYKKDTLDFKHQGANLYTFFTIPIYLSWQKALTTKSTLFLDAGVLVDFLVSSKGNSLSKSPYKELVPLSALPLSPVNATCSLGAGIAYKLQNEWSVYFKASYDFQINSSFSKAYPVRKKPRNIGLTIGILWK